MTEDEHIKLCEAGSLFWEEFSRLVGATVSAFSPEMESEVLAHLSDRSSVFGSEYNKHVDREPDLTLVVRLYEIHNWRFDVPTDLYKNFTAASDKEAMVELYPSE